MKKNTSEFMNPISTSEGEKVGLVKILTSNLDKNR